MSSVKVLLFYFLASGCATLHHAQTANIEAPSRFSKPIEVKVSEYAVDLDEANDLLQSMSKNQKRNEQLDDAVSIIKLFQMGPRTGVPVLNEHYARNVGKALRARCPRGKITNIVSIREAREYPVIKGEIVKIRANCEER